MIPTHDFGFLGADHHRHAVEHPAHRRTPHLRGCNLYVLVGVRITIVGDVVHEYVDAFEQAAQVFRVANLHDFLPQLNVVAPKLGRLVIAPHRQGEGELLEASKPLVDACHVRSNRVGGHRHEVVNLLEKFQPWKGTVQPELGATIRLVKELDCVRVKLFHSCVLRLQPTQALLEHVDRVQVLVACQQQDRAPLRHQYQQQAADVLQVDGQGEYG
mmetsp:Transcript_26047/g.72827  ORF Transcript_26047/g.72827 Transcript_26047/m.72827 type:complete len:215 (+) Transcript_26047:1125-1769(+)